MSGDGDSPDGAILSEVILDSIAFLELSGEDIVDPDAAVAMLESIAAKLQRLTAVQRADFLATAARLAADPTDPTRKAFFETAPRALGLV